MGSYLSVDLTLFKQTSNCTIRVARSGLVDCGKAVATSDSISIIPSGSQQLEN